MTTAAISHDSAKHSINLRKLVPRMIHVLIEYNQLHIFEKKAFNSLYAG